MTCQYSHLTIDEVTTLKYHKGGCSRCYHCDAQMFEDCILNVCYLGHEQIGLLWLDIFKVLDRKYCPRCGIQIDRIQFPCDDDWIDKLFTATHSRIPITKTKGEK